MSRATSVLRVLALASYAGQAVAAAPAEWRCSPGTKTIFFDLGNDVFRDPESAGQSPSSRATRVGGNLASGVWASGCFDDQDRFREKPVTSDESVRLVLLNARADVDYSLLYSSGNLQPAEKVSLAPLDRGGPVCGAAGADCDVDAAELDAILAGLQGDAKDLASNANRTTSETESLAGDALQCAISLGKAPVCSSLGGLRAPAAQQDWYAKVSAVLGSVKGRIALLTQRRRVLCEKWHDRIGAFREKYPEKALEPVTSKVHVWSDSAWNDLTTYADVRQLLGLLRERPGELLAELAKLKETGFDGATAWDDIQSYHYYRSNFLRFCVGAPGLNYGSAEEVPRDRAISDTLFRYRRTARLLDHAYSARIFGLKRMDANTSVLVTVYAAAAVGTSGAAPAAAAGGAAATSEKGGASNLVPYQFSYRVDGVDRLSFSLGTAVAAGKQFGNSDRIISPKPDVLLFLNWRLWERDDGVLCRRTGLQAGVSLANAREIVAGRDPGRVDLYLGFVVWPVQVVALSAGVVDSVSSEKAVQLGFYLGVSVDIPSLWAAWQGPKQVLAQ